MSDNIRTALYDADYSCTLAGRRSGGRPMLGPGGRKALRERGHRRQGRVRARGRAARETLWRCPARAPTAAAWRATTTTCPRPPVVAVRDGEARVIVRRETEDDLLALDVDAGLAAEILRDPVRIAKRWPSSSRTNGRIPTWTVM